MLSIAQMVADTDPMTAEDELDELAKTAARLILSSEVKRDHWILVWARVFVLLDMEEQLEGFPSHPG